MNSERLIQLLLATLIFKNIGEHQVVTVEFEHVGLFEGGAAKCVGCLGVAFDVADFEDKGGDDAI